MILALRRLAIRHGYFAESEKGRQQLIAKRLFGALLGSAIEHGLSPFMIVLSDGAKQFAILVHALCWVHMERSLRRLNGVTAQQRQEIEQVQKSLWAYYRELKAYQTQPRRKS